MTERRKFGILSLKIMIIAATITFLTATAISGYGFVEWIDQQHPEKSHHSGSETHHFTYDSDDDDD